MSFSLSGSLITQSGTDTSLSGLGSVSGVTTFTQSGKTVYNIANLMLLVSGTLTMDPRTEEIWTGTSTPQGSANGNNGSVIRVTGTFNIGVSITKNSVSQYPQSTAMRLNTSVSASYSVSDVDNFGGLVVTTSGVINWYYGFIYCWNSLGFGTGNNTASGTVNTFSKSCGFMALGTSGSENTYPQIRQRSTLTAVNGFTMLGSGNISIIGNPTNLSNIEIRGNLTAYTTSGSSPDATWLTVTNYESQNGSDKDFGFWQGKWAKFTNAVYGSNMVFGSGGTPAAGSFNYGLVETRQSVTITAVNSALSAVTTGGWWVTDVDNGSRLAVNSLGNSKTNPDYTTTRTYTADFNGSGVGAYSTDGGILTHVGYRVYANAAVTPDTATENRRDYRGISNSNSDNFNFRIRAYGYVFTQQTLTLKGANGTSVQTTLVTNAFVVASEATAAAYTGITMSGSGKTITLSGARTIQELYDYTQAWGDDSGNRQYDEAITTSDGTTFTLTTGWVLTPAGNLTYTGKRIAGGTVANGTPGTWSPRLATTTVRFTAAGTYTMSAADITGTVTFTNTSGGSVTVELDSSVTYVNSGPNITISLPVEYQSVTVTGFTAGSRIQIYDTTNSVELCNGTANNSASGTGKATGATVISGSTATWTDTVAASTSGSRAIRVRISYVSGATAKEFIEASIGTCGTATATKDISYLANQTNDTTYNSNGIDGPSIYATSGITFTDAATDRVNCNIAGGSVTWPTIYATFVYWNFTATGIANDFTYISAPDTANYLLSGMKIRNTSATDLMVISGYGRDATSGLSKDIIDTAGSTGNIFLAPDHVVPYAVSGTYAITGDISTVLAAIPSASTNATAVRTELTTELGRIDVAVSSRLATSGYTSAPSAATVAAAVLAEVVEGTTTLAEATRLQNAILLGKVSGAGTGVEVFRDLADTKDRVTSTVDSDGNRTTVVLDGT